MLPTDPPRLLAPANRLADAKEHRHPVAAVSGYHRCIRPKPSGNLIIEQKVFPLQFFTTLHYLVVGLVQVAAPLFSSLAAPADVSGALWEGFAVRHGLFTCVLISRFWGCNEYILLHTCGYHRIKMKSVGAAVSEILISEYEWK